jgi:hypothetical protein
VFVEIMLPRATTDDRTRHARLLDDIVAQLEAVPAITSVAPLHVPPLTGGAAWRVPQFTAEGQNLDQVGSNPALSLESVHHRYFDTVGATLARGRAFAEVDRDGTLPVAIVSEDVAAAVWPDTDPIGKRLKMGGPDSTHPWYTVVGVARSVRYGDITRPHPTLYLPDAQFIVSAETIAVRTTAPLALIATVARDRVRAVDGSLHVTRVVPFGELRRGLLAPQRFNALLLGLFGVAALLLAAVGLSAVLAASVRQRHREIGIRIAVGATAHDAPGSRPALRCEPARSGDADWYCPGAADGHGAGGLLAHAPGGASRSCDAVAARRVRDRPRQYGQAAAAPG